MNTDRPIVSNRSLALRLLGVLLVTACATATVPAPKTQVRLEPVPAAQDTTPRTPLPALPSSGAHVSLSDRSTVRRLSTLSVTNQDVSVVVRELAAKFGMQYQIDPSVRGAVNANLRNATLQEALAAVVPQGATFQVQDNVIRVGPARLETRIFSLDYVALSRVGTASTVIQRRLGANGAGTSAFGATNAATLGAGIGGGGGADFITAVSVADVWEEIRVATEALVFEAPTAVQTTPALASGLASGGMGLGSTGRPYSRVSPEGRRLIINPMSGTITISALPAELDEVGVFIRTFEASIQRQVLIEAKIVEVNLDRTFEFGIDWNAVVEVGSGEVVFRSVTTPRGTGNVQFTLSGGAGEITAVLNALETQGDVRVLSSPRVSALNNQRAVFDVTTGEIVFQVRTTLVPNAVGQATPVQEVTPQQVNVGIVLDVLPQIGADNTVTMNIRPVVTSVARTATFTNDEGTTFQAPVIDTRETDTMARLRGNETIIIGGLMQTRRERQRGGIPFLRSIPLLGILFTTYKDVERKAELVIFLTPTIIAGQPPAAR